MTGQSRPKRKKEVLFQTKFTNQPVSAPEDKTNYEISAKSKYYQTLSA